MMIGGIVEPLSIVAYKSLKEAVSDSASVPPPRDTDPGSIH